MQENYTKITNAVYKLLDTLPDGEPLKNRTKEKSLDVLMNLSSGNNEKSLEDIQILKQYLEIIKGQGWMDNMNFLILIKEYETVEVLLKQQIRNQKHEILNKSQIQNTETLKAKNLVKEPIKSEVFSARQSQIIKILKKSEKAQVVDLIKELPDVTKRTVRRDLDDLIKRGKIVRAGKFNQVFYQIS